MARYTAEFNQLRTNKHFHVMISTGGDTSSIPSEVLLGASPFQVSYVGDDMYKPARYSKATMEVRTSDYLMSLYAAGAQDVKVVMRENNASGAVVWTGYATPNIYDMGFAYQRNTIQLELVDALSTLQYYPYERVGNVASFLDIIKRCLTKAGAYTEFYFSANTQRSSSGTSELLSTICISESNFFDEKNDPSETDADVAWTYKDVLEEICKYMGVTAIAVGDAVYFVDMDAVGKGNHSYYKYTLSGTTGTSASAGSLRTIAASDFSGANSTISLSQIYNKVRVKDSLYDFDNVIPEVFQEEFLENITATDQSGSYSRSIGYIHSWMLTVMGTTQEGRQLKVLATDAPGSKYKNYVKYLANSRYKLHQYVLSNSGLVPELEEVTNYEANYTDLITKYGAYLVRISTNGVSEYSQEPANVSFNDFICIRWITYDSDSGQGRADITSADKYPMIETDDDSQMEAFFGGNNAYIILQGKVRCLAETCGFRPNGVFVQDKSHNNFGDRMWLPAMLKIGSYYWNGSQWTTTSSKFKLYFSESDHLDTGDPHDTDGGLNADKFYNQDFSFRNTVTYEDGLDEEGYAIPLAGLPLTLARPQFIIYNPHHMVKDNYLESVWISGLKMLAAIANPDNEDKNSDTEYVNVINNGSVSAKSAVTLKICTWDNKKPNYSAPAFYDGSSFTYVDKLYNRACQSGEDTWQGSDSSGSYGTNGLRQEEHLIYRQVNQYSAPAVILKLPLRGNISPLDRYTYGASIVLGKTFVLTAFSIDYKMNTSMCTFEEKK